MTLGAERLDVSQPAVSKQVRELERALGVHLFDRVGRRVRLSRAGEVLADYARRLSALAHEAEEAMTDVRAAGTGEAGDRGAPSSRSLPAGGHAPGG
jgi:DNA-binding transcriptional LysR family regulator